MRTKALLGLAALAVSAATCVAQSNVYSLNIVGYVNVAITPGLNLISNPLKPSNGNYNITNTISLPDTADGALLYKWAGTAWASQIPSWIGGFGWDPTADILLGEAFFLNSPAAAGNYNVTFVGEVQTGDVPYTLNPGLNMVAPKTPVAQRFPGADIGHDGDTIYTWAGSAWSGNFWSFIDGFGWDGGASPDNNIAGPTVAVGGGVAYQNLGTTLTWTRTFNPQ
jgi:hypothetical protein